MRAFVNGNQTLIKTSTGIWSVTYNAENRPVRWECGDVVVTMNFDRMGRRVFYKEEVNGVVTKHHRFVYDNYLCVQKVDALNNNSQINLFVWDPTEPVATRPLFTQRGTGYKFFYTFDGNKNISELVHFEARNGIAVHYDYAPFGAVTRAISASAITDNTFTTDNPFRFSSEYHDDTLGLVYYNYRHYNPIDGRWCGRDRKDDLLLEYSFVENNSFKYDILGLLTGSPLSTINFTIYRPTINQTPSLEDVSCRLCLRFFEEWFANNENLEWTKELRPCPKELKYVAGQFINPDVNIWVFSSKVSQAHHPGGTYELRMSASSGVGNQCIYDECGKIITSIPAAGTADFVSPKESPIKNFPGHFKEDMLPFYYAKFLDMCYPNSNPTFMERYYMRRPIIIEE